MKVLVTGGAGYIGYDIVRALQEDNDISEIVVYDNLLSQKTGLFLSGKDQFSKVRFIKGDILDHHKLERAMSGCSKVIHLAARVSTPFSYEDAHLYEQTNLWGTEQVAEAIERTKSVEQVIYLSSCVVYAPGNGIQTVNDEPQPRSPYGLYKWKGEQLLNRLAPEIDLVIIRAGNVFGYNPNMRLDTVINRFVFYAHLYGRVQRIGSGKEKRPFVSLETLCTWFKEVMKTDGPGPGIYNAVDFNASVDDLITVISTLVPNLEWLPVSQHLNLPSFEVEPSVLKGYTQLSPEKHITTMIHDFRRYFSLGFHK